MFSCLKKIVSKINNLLNEGLRSCDEDEKADLHSRSWANGTESKRFTQSVHKGLTNLLFILVKNVKRRLASLQPNLFLA